MNTTAILIDALKYYNIDILNQNGNHFIIGKNYEIEVEPNGLYKLRCDGQVIAPFNDIDELCLFVLS